MNPQNIPNQNNGEEPVADGALKIEHQIDQRATEAARNIVSPVPTVIAPSTPELHQSPISTNTAYTPNAQSPQITTPFSAQPTSSAPAQQPSMVTPILPQTQTTSLPNQASPFAPQPVNTSAQPISPSSGAVSTAPVVMGSVDNPIVPPSVPGQKPPSNRNRKKLVIAGGLSALAITAAVSAFMFLWYIPNKPGNVWNTGLSRTGQQFDALIEKLQDEETTKKLEKSAFVLKGTLAMDSQNYSLDIDSKYDPQNSVSIVKVSGTGDQPDSTFALDAEVRAQLVADAVFPNIYFKLSGLNNLGFDSLFPGINQYDNKWIAIEQDYLKSLSDSTAPVNGQENITEKDVMTIAADINAVSKEYVFTDDAAKAVIQQTQFIATEESEGIQANHYKAKFNAENTRAYCAAVVDKLSQNAAVKKITNLPEQEYAAEVQKQKDECAKATISEAEFDMWIDKKIKVIHKLRQYEDLEKAKKEAEAEKAKCEADIAEFRDMMGEDGASFCSIYEDRIETGERYSEFGQVFKNKDSILLFIGSKSATNKDTSSARGEVTINVKDLTAEGSIKASAEGENKYNLDVTLKTQPFDGTIDANKPEGAIPIQQIIDSLGLTTQL